MILKDKKFTNSTNAKLQAGDEAERKMAFYLQREFRKRDDCFVINDLRIVHDGDVAQIDHLVVSTFGLFIIESKSVHGTISVDKHKEWRRTYDGKIGGMSSPVLQAQAQGRVLREFLMANKSNLLGKAFFGQMQKGFKNCPIEVCVAISDSGIIQRDADVSELFKADAVTTAITQKLDSWAGKVNLFAPKNFFSRDIVWDMSRQEAQAVAEFLVAQHTPLRDSVKVEQAQTHAVSAHPTEQLEKNFVPKVGALCPKCKKQKLIRKSVGRSDGTETDFLACEDYPAKCDAMFPLVAVMRQVTPSPPEQLVTTPSNEELCPRCKTGKLIRKPGKNGQSDFYGCSNFGKQKCRFTRSID